MEDNKIVFLRRGKVIVGLNETENFALGFPDMQMKEQGVRKLCVELGRILLWCSKECLVGKLDTAPASHHGLLSRFWRVGKVVQV